MAEAYQAQRQKNIESNKALLLSLGLEKLQTFPPAAAAAVSAPAQKPKPKASVKPKPKPKAKEVAQKRKRDDVEESEDGKTKAARLEGDDGEGRRRSTRRGAKPVTYNEDDLFEKKEKQATESKLRSQELGEDRTGRVGNRLGQRKHDPYV